MFSVHNRSGRTCSSMKRGVSTPSSVPTGWLRTSLARFTNLKTSATALMTCRHILLPSDSTFVRPLAPKKPSKRTNTPLTLNHPISIIKSDKQFPSCTTPIAVSDVMRLLWVDWQHNFCVHLVLKVQGEDVDPLGDPRGQRLLERARIHLQEPSQRRCWQCCDLILHVLPQTWVTDTVTS